MNNEKKVIHLDISNIGKLVCDNPECLYELPKALPWNENLIGHRCPMCNSDMLTRQDYKIARMYIGCVGFINKICKYVPWINTTPDDSRNSCVVTKVGGPPGSARITSKIHRDAEA